MLPLATKKPCQIRNGHLRWVNGTITSRLRMHMRRTKLFNEDTADAQSHRGRIKNGQKVKQYKQSVRDKTGNQTQVMKQSVNR